MTTVLLTLESIDRKLDELLKRIPKRRKTITVTGVVPGPSLDDLRRLSRKAKRKKPRK